MKLGIIGSRIFSDYGYLESKLEGIEKHVTCVVSGGALGADFLGEKWARSRGIETKIIYPDWKKWGKRAGFLRNEDIVRESDVIVAFWDGESQGTRNSIYHAERTNKDVIVYYFMEEKDSSEKLINYKSILNWDLHHKLKGLDLTIDHEINYINHEERRSHAITKLTKEIKKMSMKKVRFNIELHKEDLESFRRQIKSDCQECFIQGYYPDRIIADNIIISLTGTWSDYDYIVARYEEGSIRIYSIVLTEEPKTIMEFDVFENILDSLRKIDVSSIRANPLMQMCSILFDQIYGKDSIHMVVAHVLMEDREENLDEDSQRIFKSDRSLWQFMERGV